MVQQPDGRYFPARDIEQQQAELMHQQGSFGGQVMSEVVRSPGTPASLTVPRKIHSEFPPSPSGVVRSYQRSGVHPTIT
jgi:hypothetical protein